MAAGTIEAITNIRFRIDLCFGEHLLPVSDGGANRSSGDRLLVRRVKRNSMVGRRSFALGRSAIHPDEEGSRGHQRPYHEWLDLHGLRSSGPNTERSKRERLLASLRMDV